MKTPEKGQKMYVWGSCSISNGSSDTAGGLATIKKVNINETLGVQHMNGIMVEFEELPGHGYNYKMLERDQEKLAKQYKDKVAHPDPDIDTPWIEQGDIVNGAIYGGPPIW